MKIAHIINVTEIDDSKKPSYLHIAQPLTIKSMIAAMNNAKSIVDVELLAVKHESEKVDLPLEFTWAKDLKKYAWEYIDTLKQFTPYRPLPRLHDIIQSLYTSSDAEYFIYTNLDIALTPNFYLEVKEYISQGFDAFCINRRDLPKEYRGIALDENTYELCCMIDGVKHVGIDCFVFKRDIVPSLKLGNVFIGYPPVGKVMKTQIELNSANFHWIKDARITFHLGRDNAWKNHTSTYGNENQKQAAGLYVVTKNNNKERRPLKRLKAKARKIIQDFRKQD